MSSWFGGKVAQRALSTAISALSRHQRQPFKEEDGLREVIEASPVGMAVVDGDGRIVLVNAEVERMFGYARRELIGQPVEWLLPEGLRAQHVRQRVSFARAPKRRSMGQGRALYGVRKDGHQIPLEIGLNPLKAGPGDLVIASIIDISDRVRTERERERLLAEERRLTAELERRVDERTAELRAALSEQQTRQRWFSTTMRSIADAVVSVDRDGAVAFMNPAAERLLATPFVEAKGRAARALIHIVDRDGGEPTEGPLDRALRERQVVELTGATIETPSAQLQIADSAAPVIDDGELLGAVMVFRDVTAEREAQRQLAIADRMASLGTLAAGVAHEINNPLFVVMANADFIMEKLETLTARIERPLREEMTRAQRDLLSAATRIRRIVSDLKTFSHPERGPGSTCDLGEAVTWAVRATAHEFRGRATVVVAMGSAPPVAGDETRIGQVLVNLLQNAAQAIEPGRSETNKVIITTRTDQQGHAVIDISDSGPGMSATVVARIFEPFFTTKPVGVGTGLGLAICRGLVTSLGGDLTVDSKVGVGSTFHVRLPPAARRQKVARAPAPSPGRKSARVLLIDDDELVLQAMARALDGHTVVCKSSARAALDLLATDTRFDVIFCDLLMPEMSGVDLYEALSREAPMLANRVVFMTGGVTEGLTAGSLSAVPGERLQKPFGPGELQAVLERMLAHGR